MVFAPFKGCDFFDACKELSHHQKKKNSKLCDDTNAQENVGRQFQTFAPKSKLAIGEAILHAWKFCNAQVADRRAVGVGIPTSYGAFEKP
jgi:hypothetical protein